MSGVVFFFLELESGIFLLSPSKACWYCHVSLSMASLLQLIWKSGSFLGGTFQALQCKQSIELQEVLQKHHLQICADKVQKRKIKKKKSSTCFMVWSSFKGLTGRLKLCVPKTIITVNDNYFQIPIVII